MKVTTALAMAEALANAARNAIEAGQTDIPAGALVASAFIADDAARADLLAAIERAESAGR